MSSDFFEPINKAHAIVEMVFFFEFSRDLGSSIEQLLPLKDELVQEFPHNNLLQMVEMRLTSQDQQLIQQDSQVAKIAGIELRRTRQDDDSLEWLLRITATNVSIHCLEYTRWAEVWPKVNKYISTILSRLSSVDVGISALGLKYIDQFIFKGDSANYDVRQLFRQDSPSLHSRAFSSNDRWHCHTGWFEEVPELGQILSQMNIDSVVQPIAPDSTTDESRQTVIIDQTFVRRAQNADDLVAYLDRDQHEGSLNRTKLAEWMHDANKRLLREILVDSIQRRISLYEVKQ